MWTTTARPLQVSTTPVSVCVWVSTCVCHTHIHAHLVCIHTQTHTCNTFTQRANCSFRHTHLISPQRLKSLFAVVSFSLNLPLVLHSSFYICFPLFAGSWAGLTSTWTTNRSPGITTRIQAFLFVPQWFFTSGQTGNDLITEVVLLYRCVLDLEVNSWTIWTFYQSFECFLFLYFVLL